MNLYLFMKNSVYNFTRHFFFSHNHSLIWKNIFNPSIRFFHEQIFFHWIISFLSLQSKKINIIFISKIICHCSAVYSVLSGIGRYRNTLALKGILISHLTEIEANLRCHHVVSKLKCCSNKCTLCLKVKARGLRAFKL